MKNLIKPKNSEPDEGKIVMIHRLFLAIFLVNLCAVAYARTLSDSVEIHFRQSKVYLDTTFMDNSEALEHARRTIEYYHHPDSNFILKNVIVVGGASPEGSVKFNEWLSRQRAQKIFNYLSNRMSVPDSITSFTFLGRDWNGLMALVQKDSNVPFRSDVLSLLSEIVRNTADGEVESTGNLLKLKRLHGGEPYFYMYRHLFPKLRESRLSLDFGYKATPLLTGMVDKCELDTVVIRDTIYVDRIMYMCPPCKPFYMGVKTNMLYDALAVPNIGAEFYLGKNFSIVGNWMYAWWKTDPTHKYWRVYGGDIALRWWFGNAAFIKPLTGHHLGVYGGLITYDFEWGGKGYMGGIPRGSLWDRCNHYFGVEYGYSLPIARRLNIDFTIGIGYLGGEYREYVPIDQCYVWQATKYRHWFGPTKAEISLVWLIGCNNFNRKKGGKNAD